MLLKKMQQYWMSILKDKKIFMGNYYICKIFAMILIVLIVFTGCGQNRITEKEEKKEEAANIYAEILEDETEPGKREELYKKMVQLYETAGRRDMASDTCIQGIKELGESEELKLTHIRLICSDPAVNRDTCALKIKEYVTEDTELLENAEFKKLQKEYGIKAEGGNIWVGR